MNFLELLICAKAGDNEAAERILGHNVSSNDICKNLCKF